MGAFTSVGRSTYTQGILLWLNRNDSVDTIDNTPADGWRNFLQRQLGLSGTDGKRDLERMWLALRIAALGGSSTDMGITELWTTYLSLQGVAGTSLDEQFANWLDHGTV